MVILIKQNNQLKSVRVLQKVGGSSGSAQNDTITDLTGTKWVLNENLNFPGSSGFTINLDYNNSSFGSIGFFINPAPKPIEFERVMSFNNTDIYNFDNVGWIFDARTIEITGGDDATNSDLISWLEANATQIVEPTSQLASISLNSTMSEPQPSVIRCTVSNLGNVSPSNVVFTKSGDFTKAGLGIEDVELDGNVFVKIPKLYRKVNSASSNQITSFTISNTKVNADYHLYPCFIDEDGNELDYVLIGKYFNKNSSGMNSVVNGDSVKQTLDTARSYARALGTGYQLYDWMMMRMWQDLIICIMETVDTNNGSGLATDALGISWETAEFWVDGIIKGKTDKWWICDKPSSYVLLNSISDEIPTDYVATSYSVPPTLNFIVKLGYDMSNPFANFIAGASGGSKYSYYCDYYRYNSGSRSFFSCVGATNAEYGAFYSDVAGGEWYSYCARLCYRPITKGSN